MNVNDAFRVQAQTLWDTIVELRSREERMVQDLAIYRKTSVAEVKNYYGIGADE
jgi:hypothetical protein